MKNSPPWYMTPTNQHRGIAFREQSMAFIKRGHQVGMLVPPTRFRTFHGLAEMRTYWQRSPTDLLKSDLDEIPTYRIPWWGVIPSILVPLRKGVILNAFDQYVSVYGKPDIIHSRSFFYGGFAAAAIREKRSVPAAITEIASIFVDNALLPDHHLTLKYAASHLDLILANSNATKHNLNAYIKRDITVVHNPVNIDFFTPPTVSPSSEVFKFIIIGNLFADKGHAMLLEAFAQTHTVHPSCQLHIVGDGRERSNLEQQAEALGVTEQVVFHGRQPRDSVRDMIQQSHCVVSASNYETFGITLIEAIACGVPIIATQSGGPDDIVNQHNGMLIPIQDVEAMTHALKTMIQTYDQYDSEKIRQDAVERFSQGRFVQNLVNLFTTVIEDERSWLCPRVHVNKMQSLIVVFVHHAMLCN